MADLLAILDALDCRNPVLIGHSMGTYVAQELLFRYPERAGPLVMIGGTCITLNRLSALEAFALRISPLLFRLYPYERLRRVFARASSITPDVRAYLYEAAGGISKRNFLTIWTATAGCLHYEPGYRITQPLLICHGDQDRTGNIKRIAPLWAARDLNARSVVIPDAGHCAHQDNPAFFNMLLLDFLRLHL